MSLKGRTETIYRLLKVHIVNLVSQSATSIMRDAVVDSPGLMWTTWGTLTYADIAQCTGALHFASIETWPSSDTVFLEITIPLVDGRFVMCSGGGSCATVECDGMCTETDVYTCLQSDGHVMGAWSRGSLLVPVGIGVCGWRGAREVVWRLDTSESRCGSQSACCVSRDIFVKCKAPPA